MPKSPAVPVNQRCGYVALVGATNAGKSTLLNMLVGEKVSIVTHKVQTTRFAIRAVLTEGDAQVILVDTPGLFTPQKKWDKALIKAADAAWSEADLILHIVDVSKPPTESDRNLQKRLEGYQDKVCLVLNKIDKIKQKEELLPLITQMNDAYAYTQTFPISAKTGEAVRDLQKFLVSAVPESPWLFLPDQLTDLSQQLAAAEMVREQILLQLHQEIPYGIAVIPEKWELFCNGSVKISQIILVSKEGHKGIVLGQKGQKIKKIREAAQRSIEAMVSAPVHLFLTIKVDERWMEKPHIYEMLGMPYDG